MRVPQVNERVKEAPAHALRAVFAGIGQLMLITDRLRNRPADETDKETSKKDAAVPAQAPAPVSAAPSSNVTVVEKETVVVQEDAAEAPATATEETVTVEADVKVDVPEAPEAPVPPAAETPAAEAPAAEKPAAGEPPLPNYDELTVPSLRARMRNLTADQLTELIAYEGAHANRGDVIAMFERRIAKLAES
jgi:hypothetical protein